MNFVDDSSMNNNLLVDKMKKKILDAGCGDNPWFQATHLCDLYLRPTLHRTGNIPISSQILKNRPFVCCDIQNLPFKSKIFDFVYSWHVLEHVGHPSRAIQELKRVGRHGCAIFPSQLWELFFQKYWPPHRWVVNPKGRHFSLQSRPIKILKKLVGFFWRRNWRIRFRERLFGLPMFENRFLNKQVRW